MTCRRGIGRLGAGGHGQGAAVGGVHGRVVQVGGDAPGAADAGHHAGPVGVELERQNGVDQRPGDDAVGAARAPERLGRAQVRGDLGGAVRRDARQAGVVGRPLEQLFVDEGVMRLLEAVIVELASDEVLDLLGGDELAVDAPVVDHLGAAGDRRLDLPATSASGSSRAR